MRLRGWRSFNGLRVKRCTCRRTYATERPPSLPKPIPDVRHIRLNPDLYKQNCLQRNYGAYAENGWKILELHNKLSEIRGRDQDLFRQAKDLNKLVGSLSKSDADKDRREYLIQDAKAVRTQLDKSKEEISRLEDEISTLALEVPNLNAPPVPDGPDPEVLEFSNVPAHFSDEMDYGSVPTSSSTTSHLDIAEELGLLDMAAASRLSGTGFYYFIGQGAMLEQALIQHALHICIKAGFTPVSPPTIVHKYAASMAGYAPRDVNGETQIFALEHEANEPQKVLTGTSEIALAGMHAGQNIDPKDLPKKYVGLSRCYRAEAGGRGKDTKGVYRVHEFTKVELFAWTLPDQFSAQAKDLHFDTTSSATEASSFWQQPALQIFNLMKQTQLSILTPLNLPLRVLAMPPTDLGASAAMKVDIESFFPGRPHAPWGELASLSLCTDYQSRRMGTTLKNAGDGTKFPYTLNGTALAVPRVWACLLENGWDEKAGVVKLPECLWRWMGVEEIGRVKGKEKV